MSAVKNYLMDTTYALIDAYQNEIPFGFADWDDWNNSEDVFEETMYRLMNGDAIAIKEDLEIWLDWKPNMPLTRKAIAYLEPIIADTHLNY